MVKIYVGNLSKSARREDLMSLFTKFGNVTECDILREFGFVHMDTMASAQEAVRSLNGTQLCGTSIRVEISTGGTKRESRGPPPRDRERYRERSPIGRRERDDSYYRDPYDPYSNGPGYGGGSSSYYGMLASAAANVHDQLLRERVQDPTEIYHRMYHAISSAAAQGNPAPPLFPPPGGYGGREAYSGNRYADDHYGNGSYRDSYERGRRY